MNFTGIEAIAVCPRDCDKARCGLFPIHHSTQVADQTIRKLRRHAQACRTAQELKAQRMHMLRAEKKADAANTASDESSLGQWGTECSPLKPEPARKHRSFAPQIDLTFTADASASPETLKHEQLFMKYLLNKYAQSIELYVIKTDSKTARMAFQFRYDHQADADKCKKQYMDAHDNEENSLNDKATKLILPRLKAAKRWSAWRKKQVSK